MNPKIFRQYDIRGLSDEDFSADDFFTIGHAFGSYMQKKYGKKSFCVGQDCRKTSKLYSEKLIEGLRKSGANVLDVKVVSSPVLYFSIQHFAKEGGIMVTASHNPKEYNGLKLCNGVDSIHSDEILEFKKFIDEKKFIDAAEQGKYEDKHKEVMDAYFEFMKQNINIKRKIKVGVDAGNGVAGPIFQALLENFPCEIYPLYCDMDGDFPNHPSDPTVEKYMKELQDMVVDKKLDLGIGFDGDGDRVGIVDEKGKLLYGDELMIIFAREILTRKKNAVFISEVKASKLLYDDIKEKGGKCIMWKAGHSFIKQKLKEEKGELAGEVSGHIFFKDRYFGFDDAIYSALRFLELLSSSDQKVSDFLCDLPKTYKTPEIRVDCSDDVKFKLVEDVTKHLKSQYEVVDIDGARVIFEDGWGLIRASNTQPALVLRFEALSEARVIEIRKIIEDCIQEKLESI